MTTTCVFLGNGLLKVFLFGKVRSKNYRCLNLLAMKNIPDIQDCFCLKCFPESSIWSENVKKSWLCICFVP